MKKRILTLLSLITIGALLVQSNGLGLFDRNTAYAVGDLTVNWGIGIGDVGPIFNESNIAPGFTDTKTVNVANGATSPRQVAVRGILTSDAGNMDSVMNIEIKEGPTLLYANTLEQFFADSAGPNGVELSLLNNGNNTDYSFKVTFGEDAGNDFQNQAIIFDIQIGIAVETPAECDLINFNGSPIFGTSGNDRINGTSKSELIVGFEGNDRINGGGGDDCIVAGSGNDKVDGQTGADVIDLGGGNDRNSPSAGIDIIYGGGGNDNIDAGSENDLVFGGEGNDHLVGGSGNDVIHGENGNDQLFGGSGNDTLLGESGNDTMHGGSGGDNLTGGDGLDNANGDSGTDTCDAETETKCEL